jgi:hypothetical protein
MAGCETLSGEAKLLAENGQNFSMDAASLIEEIREERRMTSWVVPDSFLIASVFKEKYRTGARTASTLGAPEYRACRACAAEV